MKGIFVFNHRWLVIIIAFLQLAWGQQPTATTQTPVTTKPTQTAPLRIDSLRRVEPGNMYHRVYARVRLIGSGTKDDPKRPMFAPPPGQAPKDHTGILGYQMQISDDGKWALCEFVGATPKDLEIITKSNDPTVKFFERGHSTLQDVLADFVIYKANFTFAAFGTRVQ